MKILIIGSSGFIGTELSVYLCNVGNEVFAVDIKESSDVRTGSMSNFHFYNTEAVLTQKDIIREIDCMVILAGIRPYSDFNINDYIKNISLTESYIRLAIECGIRNIVFASSKAVYSGNSFPWREEEYSVPSSLYGASKVACEQLGLFYAHKYGISFKALRFAQVIGFGERKGFFINTLIDNAIAKKTLVIYGSGMQKRHYIYIKDVCRAVLKASEKISVSGVFNIGMQQSYTNLELAESVNEAFDNRGNLIHDYDKVMDAADDEMETAKASNFLNFTAEYDLLESFKDMNPLIQY